MTNLYDNIIVKGDINVNTIDKTSTGFHHYEEVIDTFGLKNLIKTNTCFTKTSSTSLDVILTNRPKSFFHTQTIETGISDCHVLVGTILRAHIKRQEPTKIEYRQYKRFDENSFLND